jgi:addiction module RelE/StbE family toxin
VWKVILSSEAELELKEALINKEFSFEDIQILKAWVSFIEYHGPKAIEEDYKWDDHPLRGKWSGCRSTCISNSGRIIYRIIKDKVIVLVLRVTASHNYR